MSSHNKTEFDIDCVYTPDNSEDVFRNAHVRMELNNDQLDLTISPEMTMSITEIQEILSFLRKDRFDRMRLSLCDDFRIFIDIDDEKKRVVMNGQTVSHLE